MGAGGRGQLFRHSFFLVNSAHRRLCFGHLKCLLDCLNLELIVVVFSLVYSPTLLGLCQFSKILVENMSAFLYRIIPAQFF